MDRRESLKSLLVGSVAGGLLVTGCAPETTVETPEKPQLPGYGRNEREKEHDEKVLSETFFNEHELETIAVLCDIILPANAEFGSASDAGVPEFIEFIAKDMPNNQLPIRGGLAWLDSHSNKLYGMEFKKLNDEQHKTICDSIAYPGKTAPELKHGERFFTWDGIPEDVLKQQGMAYEEEWLAKCVDQTKRMDIATWDDDGNLLT